LLILSLILLQLASFTVLGQLRLAFMNSWDKVDRILEEQGLNQKDAFRYENYNVELRLNK